MSHPERNRNLSLRKSAIGNRQFLVRHSAFVAFVVRDPMFSFAGESCVYDLAVFVVRLLCILLAKRTRKACYDFRLRLRAAIGIVATQAIRVGVVIDTHCDCSVSEVTNLPSQPRA